MKQCYEYSLKAFGRDNINSRYDFLLETIDDFLNTRNIRPFVTINKLILQELVIDYFSDTRRIRDFLKTDRNIVSYLGYWIMKKRPLVIARRHDYKMRMEKPFLEFINEWFVFHIILNFKHSPEKFSMFLDI